MGCSCLNSIIWKSISFECPTHIALKDLSERPKRRTPLDRLGFPQRCCLCCSLRVASFLICLFSFVWGGVELVCAERALALACPDRGATFKYCKLAYNALTIIFLLLCGGLLLGIILRKECPIFVFVWYALLYTLASLGVAGAGVAGALVRDGAVASRHAARFTIGLIWSSVYVYFVYLLMVLNSYKLAVWYLSLGFDIRRDKAADCCCLIV